MSTPAAVDAYPLSPMQRGMLFHSLEPGAAGDLYVEQLCCTLSGELQEESFAAAWAYLLGRHAVLRTAFAWQGLRQPLQVVGSRSRLPLEILDWRHLEGAEQQAELARLQRRERSAGFKLSRAPLLRLTLVRLGAQEHRLIWTWHHIILDAWSVPILLEELFASYVAQSRGQPLDLEEPTPFKTFIAWHEARDSTRAEQFWRARLRNFARPTPLELARPKAAGNEPSKYALEFVPLSAEETEAVFIGARRWKVTANTLVQGAWALLLSRYSGQPEVVFGTAVAGRPPELQGIERMIGMTINTIPVRVEAPPSASLGPWLEKLQQRNAEAQPEEHAALREVQRWSEMLPGTPLFESLLVFENFPVDKSRLNGHGLALSEIEFFERADFPLTVTVSPGELRMGAGFDAERFDRAGIRSLLQHLRALLAGMSRSGTARLSDLSVVSAEERQLLRQWSSGPEAGGNGRHVTAEEPVHRSFERIVEASPSAIAATYLGPFGDVTLTYRELNAAANRLARELQRRGLPPGARLAICGDASLGQLVSVLAVLKAGGAYVPLPPESPPALLRSMIEDCGAALILSAPAVSEALRDVSPVPVMTVPEVEIPVPGAEEANLPANVGPKSLAYLIFTSGSTGRPKAVAVTHASLGRLVEAQTKAFGIEPQSRVLQFASLSFDASVSEIFTALLAGAQLCLAPRQLLLPSREMVALVERWRVTHLTLPPSVLARLPAARLPWLKTLVSAGEPCPAELVERWGKERTFLNAYGPTEGTVCATIARPVDGTRAPPIGRPMGDTRVYLLDSDLQPVGVGLVGELYLGGPGVARGYWGQTALTAASFVPDLFSPEPGSRMYRTGDRGRYLPDGEIELLGRVDAQVKIRGHRIELGQVEAALRSDAAVEEAAAVVIGDSAANRSLFGFVVPKRHAGSVTKRSEWWPSLAEYLVYDELAYHAMTSDERRNESYREALRQIVPGRVVVEVGTGPEALLARFCLDAGARHVYAIELLESTFELARRRIAELGLADRITLVHGDARTVSLPEPAEVGVSEIVGAIGGCEGAAVILNESRRLLAPNAEVVPARSTTLYAPVELNEELRENLGFRSLPARYVEKIFAEIGHPFDLRLCVKGITSSALLASPQILEDLDFRGVVPLSQERRGTFRCQRSGRFDGFLVWLTLDTGAGELIDILEHEHCWLPVFFPAFDPALLVAEGDEIESHSGWHLNPDELHPDYFVKGQVVRAGLKPAPFAHTSRHHSREFRGTPFLQRFFANGAVPRLPEENGAFDYRGLRERLKQRLPEWMVPSELVQLAALPLNANGKVDRQALQRYQFARGDAEAAPRESAPTDLERLIAGIWKELLGTGEVGRRMNFFDHGGHSLMLLEVQEKLQALAGVEIAVTDLFKYPTVESLARRVRTLGTVAGENGSGKGAAHARVTARRDALAERLALKDRLKEKLKRKLR